VQMMCRVVQVHVVVLVGQVHVNSLHNWTIFASSLPRELLLLIFFVCKLMVSQLHCGAGDGIVFALAVSVTVFLRPLSPCDLVQAESQLAACATPFRPSPLRHKRHGAKWAPNIRCSDHLGCCVARTFHLPSFVFSRSLRSVFHTLVASMVLFRCFKWVAIRRARIAVGGF
jgi:hypothetical protein